MKPKIILRIASISMLLHTIGHTIGAMTWKKDPDPAIQQVVDKMISQKFVFLGALRSIGDFYEGYGITMIFVLLLMAVLLWQLATTCVTYPGSVAKLLVPISLSLLVIALVEFRYFFFLPGTLTGIAGILSVWSVLIIRKNITVGSATL
jgi:hypothetical protein